MIESYERDCERELVIEEGNPNNKNKDNKNRETINTRQYKKMREDMEVLTIEIMIMINV